MDKENYVAAYKTAFICGCLKEATNESLREFLEKNDDPGTFTEIEILTYSIALEADSFGRVNSTKIQPIGHPDAGYNRPLLAGCIRLGMSKEVDKIARKKYKEFIRGLGRKLEFIYEEE